jgi:hypothetical protein
MDYRELAMAIAREYGLDPEIFVRQMVQESGLNPDAVSSAGAVGIAQIMPDTAKDPGYGIAPISDRRDPEASLRFGAQYMRAMLDKYGDYGKALAAYNAGPGAVDKYGGIPPFKETQNYVSVILGGKMQPSVKGGMSMGAPESTLPSEELMFGVSEDPEKDVILESLMARFRPEDQGQMAEDLARFAAINAQGPGGRYAPQNEGIFSLPEARSTPTAVERLRGLG